MKRSREKMREREECGEKKIERVDRGKREEKVRKRGGKVDRQEQ